MRRQAVDSSVIAAVGYDPRTTVLEVTFKNGRVYEYFGVPREELEALLSADSVGKYFNEEIKPRYQAARVRKEERMPSRPRTGRRSR